MQFFRKIVNAAVKWGLIDKKITTNNTNHQIIKEIIRRMEE